jgi:threonine dehydrogenase-like Zn-dependent dehydrogenase
MKAVCWCGTGRIRVENVPEPRLLNPRDAVVRITATAICGSDLHLYDGFIPTMFKGDILGHEFMGEVVEVGKSVTNLRPGDRVVVPFDISCGNCFFCRRQMYSVCDNSNPNAWIAEKLYGYSGAGLFGYSHMTGGYAGGQAEYARVPFADVGPIKIPDELSDEQVLFLSDILPTAYQAALNCDIEPGDTVAIWGCGPVGLLSIKCAYLLKAERVIAIDRVPERLRMARDKCEAEILNYERTDVRSALKEMTGGIGPDACIDAVGLEAHGAGILGLYDRIKTALMLETDRAYVLRQIIHACRKGGRVSIAGVYGGLIDKTPMGAAFQKSLVWRMGQTHVQSYMKSLLDLIRKGSIDPSFIISHRGRLDEAPRLYEIFKHKQDECIKVVMRP